MIDELGIGFKYQGKGVEIKNEGDFCFVYELYYCLFSSVKNHHLNELMELTLTEH